MDIDAAVKNLNDAVKTRVAAEAVQLAAAQAQRAAQNDLTVALDSEAKAEGILLQAVKATAQTELAAAGVAVTGVLG